jgi:Ca2+-binding EF-hand superfamily protein
MKTTFSRKTMLAMAVAPVLALGLVAGVAEARGWGEDRMGGMGGGMPQMLPGFADMDADKDGKVTRAEIDAIRAERQKAMDPDGDGFVTLEEMTAHAADSAKARAEAMVDRMFARADTDKDGKLSAAEALASPMAGGRGTDRMFDRLDRDSDGAISQAEYDAAAERMAKGDRGRGEGRGHGKGEGRGHGHGMSHD